MQDFEEFDKISREIMRNSEKYKENFVNNFHSANCELRKPNGEKCTCGFVKKPTKEEKLREALEKCVDWLEHAPFDYSNGIEAMGVDEGNVQGWKGHDEVVKFAKKALEK